MFAFTAFFHSGVEISWGGGAIMTSDFELKHGQLGYCVTILYFILAGFFFLTLLQQGKWGGRSTTSLLLGGVEIQVFHLFFVEGLLILAGQE